MKIIFLDIDGVLCVDWANDADEFGHSFKQQYVDNLALIIQQTNAKIVISSTWRHDGLSQMQLMWKKRNLPGNVIDITPTLWANRGEEISEYLRENPCDKYVIIDDNSDFLHEQKNFFVRTALNDCADAFNGLGLTKKCAEKAIQILNS